MTYYVIRVAPRGETTFLQMTGRFLAEEDLEVLYPRRVLEQYKKGKKIETEVPLFPGYVFLRTEEPLSPELYFKIKSLIGFSSFIRHGEKLSQILGRDLELLLHFLKFGEVVETSTVVFDENQRIKVLSGPMEGLEGQITKVDRRKKRAKILLNFNHSQIHITLGFNVLTEVP